MNQMIIHKNSTLSAHRARFTSLRTGIKKLSKDNRGEGYLDMAMKILIVVVIGAAILGIMNAAMPELFQNLIDKISGELTGVSVLP